MSWCILDYTYVCTLMINHFYVPFVVKDFRIWRRSHCPVVVRSFGKHFILWYIILCTLVISHLHANIAVEGRGTFDILKNYRYYTIEKPHDFSYCDNGLWCIWDYTWICTLIRIHVDCPVVIRSFGKHFILRYIVLCTLVRSHCHAHIAMKGLGTFYIVQNYRYYTIGKLHYFRCPVVIRSFGKNFILWYILLRTLVRSHFHARIAAKGLLYREALFFITL